MNITSDIRKALVLAMAAGVGLQASAWKGVVTDEYGNPVPQATVCVKGTSTCATTDAEGSFDIDLGTAKVLEVTAPGYLTIEYRAGDLRRERDKKEMRIVMTQLNVPQTGTVPTLFGTTPEESYLGSASTIYTDQINRTMGSTIIPALQGKLAGLNISQYRGARLRQIKANNSLGLAGWVPQMGLNMYTDNTEFTISSRGMSPIVYVDGIERDIWSLDPDAIESVSVQKDALSTMFNGMRSSRPVVLITTKNPKAEGFRVSFTGRFGYSTPVSKPKPLSAAKYAYLLNEALQNDGRSPLYDKNDYEAFLNGSDPLLHPNVDWFDQATRDHGTSQYYNVNVSGGNKFAQYFVNAGYYYENGMFKDLNDGYSTQLKSKRYSVDAKVNMNITRDFTASVSLLARLEEGTQPGGAGEGYSNLLRDIYQTPSVAYPVFNPNGSFGGNVSFTNNLYAQASESGYIEDKTKDLLGMINLKYDFDRYVKGLSVYLRGSVTVQDRSATIRTLSNPVFQYSLNDQGEYVYHRYGTISAMKNDYRSVANYQQLWGQFGVDYERQWGLHYFKAGLSGDTRQNIHNYDLPSLPSNILQNVSYNYAQKYFAQLAVTESYFNRYKPGHRWGAFWAAGLGWDIAREDFMESTSGWLDRLKLRLVYGHTGNGVENSGYYNYYQTYSESGFGGYNWSANANTSFHYTYPTTPMANPYITWEKAHKWNPGIDVAMFGNRLTLQADYYNDKYYDLLQTRGKSSQLLGTYYPAENIGKDRYQGGEITLTWQDHVGDFNYYVTGNWNIQKTKVLFMDELNYPYAYQRQTGHSVLAYYGYVADGFFSSTDEIANSAVISGYDNIQPGDIKYRDLNSDGVIDDFDRTIIGNDKPLQYYGLDYGFDWRGLEFSMSWQGVYNRDIYINDLNLTEGFQKIGQSYGQAYELLIGRWTPETADKAILPRLSAGGNTYNHQTSSFWVKNGNFIRLKNLYLGYTLPQSICRNFLGGVRPKIFVNVQNLATIKACSWNDPEVSYTSYPLQRTWSVGVNLKF